MSSKCTIIGSNNNDSHLLLGTTVVILYINSEIIVSIGWLNMFWSWEQRTFCPEWAVFSNVFLTGCENYKIT